MTPPRLPLHDWSCLRTELVWIYDHAPQTQSRRGVFDHRDGNWAWYLRKGEVSVATKSGLVTARAGQWLLVPSEIHRHDFSDDAVLISVRFHCQWPSGENIVTAPPPAVIDGARYPALEKTARRLERFVRQHLPAPHHQQHARHPAEYALFLRFQRVFFEWLEAWYEARLATGAIPSRHAGDDRALRVARALDDAPLDQGFPKDAVRAAGVSPVQLGRLFRRQFSLSPLQYWERRRLEYARLCLETSDLPLKELSLRLGFRSAPHFTVWFKRHTHASPGRYRDRHSRV